MEPTPFAWDISPDGVLPVAFRQLLEHTDSMIFIKNTDLTYVAASAPFFRMAGKSSMDEIVGRTDFEVFENQELAKRYTDDDRILLSGDKDLLNYVEPLADNHGLPRYSSTSKYILRNAEGEPIGILGISRDITRDYIARRLYQQELQFLFELPADTYAALFMDIDDWRIIRHQCHEVRGNILPVQETMANFAVNAIRCLADPRDTETRYFFQNLSRASMRELSSRGKRNMELEYLRLMPDGQQRWVHVDIHFLVDPENSHLCAIWSMQDIDSEKQEALNLIHAAERDQMTGLLNRAFTMKYIQQILADHPDQSHALLMLDVDNFKAVNDTLGHQAGDAFLVELSATLKKCFRENDIVGRVGGDEFFVLMKNAPPASVLREKAAALLEATQALCQRYPGLDISISIGISLYPVNGMDLVALYGKADDALYQAKRQGKNQFVFA